MAADGLISSSFSMDHPPIMMEPRVVLFPLSGGNIETVRTPPKPVSNMKPLRSMLTSSTVVDPPSSNKEIMELKRRLEVIKKKRAEHRNQSNHHQLNESAALSRTQETSFYCNPNEISFESNSSSSQSWNPRRLLCSTYKAQSVISKRPRSSQKDVESNDSVDRPALDYLVCSSGGNDQRYSSLMENKDSTRDPRHYDYDHTPMDRVPPCSSREQQQQYPKFVHYPAQHRVGSLEHTVPRGKAYSEILSDGSDSGQLIDLPTRSCIPRRETPWYVRPSSASHVIPDASAQVMNMVWFSTKE
jgi:hypothetical protein